MEHDLETDLSIREIDNDYLRDIWRASIGGVRERVAPEATVEPGGVLSMLRNPELRSKATAEAREKQSQR